MLACAQNVHRTRRYGAARRRTGAEWTESPAHSPHDGPDRTSRTVRARLADLREHLTPPHAGPVWRAMP